MTGQGTAHLNVDTHMLVVDQSHPYNAELPVAPCKRQTRALRNWREGYLLKRRGCVQVSELWVRCAQACHISGVPPHVAWRAPAIPRGDLQATFVFKGYDEARRLGLSRATEAAVRAAVAAQASHAGGWPLDLPVTALYRLG
jgi:hypothetical protein